MGWKAAGLILALALLAQPVRAETPLCRPTLLAELDMLHQPDGALAVMVELNGTPQRMLIDPDVMHSYVSAEFAHQAGIRDRYIDRRYWIASRYGTANSFGRLDRVAIGSAIATDVRMLVMSKSFDGHGVAGAIGIDLLGNFGVEFDFAAQKIRVLGGCTNTGAYWAQRYGELPLDYATLGKPSATWQLDGQQVSVTFSASEAVSQMPLNIAAKKFGIAPKASTAAAGEPAAFEYRFKALTAEGVSINNPVVSVWGSMEDPICDGLDRVSHIKTLHGHGKCWGEGDVALGLSVLSKLHLLFAFPDKKLFFTAADAH